MRINKIHTDIAVYKACIKLFKWQQNMAINQSEVSNCKLSSWYIFVLAIYKTQCK